jgi:hypothetical protein
MGVILPTENRTLLAITLLLLAMEDDGARDGRGYGGGGPAVRWGK